MALRLKGQTTGYVELAAPASAADNTLTLPNGNGTNGQVLTTNGSGTLSFTTKADLASPTFTGTPAAPTASSGTNTTQLATTAFVTTAVAAGGGGATDINGLSDAKTQQSGQTIGIGTGALAANGSGNTWNTALGYDALNDNTNGQYNVAVGGSALELNVSGLQNTAVGFQALLSNTAHSNTAVGKGAMDSATTGGNNSAVGMHSLGGVTTGTGNCGLGKNAGNTTTTGSNNIVIGNGAFASSATVSNEVTLGNSSISTLRCNTQSISSLSDGRDKTDVEPLAQGLDFIDSLQPVKFKWETRDRNIKDGTYEAGFIAQDLQSAQAEVDADYLGLVMDENPDRLEASYGKLVPVLVNAVQELTSMVKVLQAEIKTLKG